MNLLGLLYKGILPGRAGPPERLPVRGPDRCHEAGGFCAVLMPDSSEQSRAEISSLGPEDPRSSEQRKGPQLTQRTEQGWRLPDINSLAENLRDTQDRVEPSG